MQLDAEVAGRLDDAEDGAAGRRLVAALGAAEADRLAGHDARDRVAGVHGVRVHHPGHDLGVGVDVRRRDVLLGPDEDLDLGEEPAGQALQLLLAELLGIDDDAALAAAVRDADDRALPGHPHREGLDLVERDVLVVADAALGRAAAQVVLDAIAGEDLDRPVVHVDREVDGELAPWLAQDEAHARVEIEAIGRQVELSLGDFPRVDARSDVLGGHGRENLRVGRPSRAAASVWVVSRTTPRGASQRSLDGCAGPIDARLMCGAEYSREVRPRRLPDGTGRQGCRNLVATLERPASRQRRRDTGRPRRRSPGRGAARRTRPTSSIETSVRVEVAAAAPASRRGTPRRPGESVCRIDIRSIGRSQISSISRSRALRPGPDAVGGLDHAVLDLDDRLDRQQRPDGRLGAADPAALLEVLERLEGQVDDDVRRARSGSRRSPRPAGPSAAISTPIRAQDPLGHRRAVRVDDVDLAVGQHVPRDLGALDRARQRARDVDRHDRLGAAREGRLVGLLELARRRCGGRRERRVRRGHPLPELLGRQVDPGLEASRDPKVTRSGTMRDPRTRRPRRGPCRTRNR